MAEQAARYKENEGRDAGPALCDAVWDDHRPDRRVWTARRPLLHVGEQPNNQLVVRASWLRPRVYPWGFLQVDAMRLGSADAQAGQPSERTADAADAHADQTSGRVLHVD